ncbi:MAG: Asp-tRNA(Asn)/Glu-tRNA(Gln) amidotransferase subunit GatC [Desulfobulbaceae bacterium]|nr:Asp-tRNA(Asn)/Glu-tRNA(Gln) amidotransferase subunit GatC [Desulfobulbaceae bacterium]HIJ89456.1 Asp-tRNA(Asn)/Glu-tRNA(Gln) amidotransferase subunit GatC [Deltaproteobacteria bacterium]
MKITQEEVRYVAKLARLELSEAEVEKTTLQLDGILSYVEKLGELDTASVQPTTHALAVRNAFREDEIRESLPQREALANGPLHNSEAFVVPRVI